MAERKISFVKPETQLHCPIFFTMPDDFRTMSVDFFILTDILYVVKKTCPTILKTYRTITSVDQIFLILRPDHIHRIC